MNRDDVQRALAEQGITLPPDELDELTPALPALQAWIRTAENLAADEPAFITPLPERW